MPHRMPCRQMPPLWLGIVVSACSTTFGCPVSAPVICAKCGVHVTELIVLDGVPLLLWYQTTSSRPLPLASEFAYTAAPTSMPRLSSLTGLLHVVPWSFE